MTSPVSSMSDGSYAAMYARIGNRATDTSGMSPSSLAAMQNQLATSDASSVVDRADDKKDKETFLRLLVAQMRYQDPSKPADSTQLMAQTATFSQVEKLQELATQNAALLSSHRTLTAGAMVGQTVSYTAADGTTATGRVSSVRIATEAAEARAVVDGVDVPMGRITTVSAGSTATSATT